MSTSKGPSGLGWWIAFEGAVTPGPKADDLARAVDRCKSTGATWVALRGGAGNSPDAAIDERSVRAFLDADIGVAVWVFDYVGSQAGELHTFARFRAAGVRWAILNAEFPYVNASAAQAQSLVDGVRSYGFEWVAHAPPDYAGGRGDGALETLDQACDAILPQVYAWEHDDRGHVHHLAAVQALYAKRGLGPDKIWPILCSYRPKTRGYDAQKHPLPTPPMTDEGKVVAQDIVAGLDHAWSLASRAPSIYTIEAASPEVWPALAAHASETTPAAPALPTWTRYFLWPASPVVSGADVKAWQQRMVSLGLLDKTDGLYGPKSAQACRTFQQAKALSVDGIVGPKTWAATFAPS